MRFIRDLGTLLKRGDFRRLFAVRLTSQFGDGVFQVALASYVLFSPERAPDAAAIAGLFAVALLPYSILGPFTGVLLDRWSRRQILFGANLTRAALVIGVGAIVAIGNAGVPFYLAVLLTLGVNRFLLSGLSAGLPHVVERDELVMANAVTPTSGTASFLIGGGVGAGVKLIADSDLAVLGLTVVVYTAAALLALRLRRNQLGPDLNGDEPGVVEAIRTIATGLVDGGRHLRERKQAGARAGRDRLAAVLLRPDDRLDDPAVPQLLLRPRPARRGLRRAGHRDRCGRRRPVPRRPRHPVGAPG